MDNGWVKLHRKFLEWEWYEDANTTRLFIHFLLLANHKPKKWRGIMINEGEFVSGRYILSKQTKLSVQSVRTSIERLKSTNEVTIKTTSRYSLFKLNNWNQYQQSNQQSNQQVTSNQPASNHKQEEYRASPVFLKEKNKEWKKEESDVNFLAQGLITKDHKLFEGNVWDLGFRDRVLLILVDWGLEIYESELDGFLLWLKGAIRDAGMSFSSEEDLKLIISHSTAMHEKYTTDKPLNPKTTFSRWLNKMKNPFPNQKTL